MMKTKSFYGLTSFLALALMSGCQNEADEMGVISRKSVTEITASMEGGETRTTLDEDGKGVLWQDGDLLSIFLGNTTNQKFTINGGAGTKKATFKSAGEFIISGGTEDVESMANVGYYPYDESATVTQNASDYTLNVSFPAMQQYAEASFGQHAFPMVAVTGNNYDVNFAFKNIASVLQVKMTGTAKIVKVTLKSAANKLAGAATVTAAKGTDPVLAMTEGATSTITLDCGKGVQLDATEATSFMIALPPATYAANDLTLVFYDAEQKCMESPITAENTFARNTPVTFTRVYKSTGDAPTELSLLQAAIEAGEASYTLTDDITVGASDSKIVIPENTTFTLDLNGKTITGSNLDFLDNKGTLTISNGKVATDAAITDGSNRRCIYNRAGATMTIDGVEFVQTCESWGAAVNNAGTMVIEDATVDSKYWSIWNETATGNLTIKGGTYNCNSYTESDESSNGGLNGNSTFSYMIKNIGGASLTIDGGTFNCTHGFAALESGSKTVINGGEINHVGQVTISSHTFSIAGAATALTINDCKIKWNTQYTAAGGSSLVWLTESVNAANIAIVGGLYDLTKVTNDSETALAVTYVDSGDATYPYKAVDAGYKQVDATNYEIYNANGMKWFYEQMVNEKNSFKGVTVKLTADIDMKDVEWVSKTETSYTNFAGVFDGNGKTISNFTATTSTTGGYATMFNLFSGEVKKLIMDGVTATDATANGRASALVGYMSAGKLSDVTIKNATITGYQKVAGLVSHPCDTEITIENCSVETAILKANEAGGGTLWQAGGLFGYASGFKNISVTGCSVKDITINGAATAEDCGESPFYCHPFIGCIDFNKNTEATATLSNNTISGTNTETGVLEGCSTAYYAFGKHRGEGKLTITVDGEQTWPVIVATVNGQGYETLEAAIAEAADGATITVAEGEIDLASELNTTSGQPAKTVTVKGAGQDKTNLKGATNSTNGYPGNYAHNMTLKFEDLTYTTANNGYNGGFGHAASVEFTNCKIVGQFYAHSNAPHKFTKCTIDPLNGYLYTYGSDCEFTECTFSASEGKALQVYEDADTGENTVNITKCTFTAAKQAQTGDGKPVTAIDINSNGAKFVVNISECKVTGFPTGLNSNSTLWNVKNLNADITVNVDNQQVYPFYKEVDGGYEISSADGMKWLSSQVAAGTTFSGKTITLTADIDLNNEAWTPIGYGFGGTDSKCFYGTFDGNGKTIKNLNIVEGKSATAGLFGYTSAATIKNFTLENVAINVETPGEGGTGAVVGVLTNCSADQGVIGVIVKGTVSINATRRVGGIVGYADGPVSGCTVTGASLKATPNLDGITYDNGDKVGGIAGYMNGNTNVNIVNNKVENVIIEGYRDLGGVAGAGYGTVTGNTVTTATIKAVGVDGSYAGGNVPSYVASVVGREQGEATVDQNTTTGVTMSINGETVTEE